MLNNTLWTEVTSSAFVMLGLPFFAFLVLILFGRIVTQYRGVFATSVMFVNTIIAVYLFFSVEGNQHYISRLPWINVSDVQVDFGIQVDSLSSLFALIVCFISFLVHLFSIEYLRGDKNFEKYFAYLGLFTFSMLGIIFSENLMQLFVFWELVGFSSYLLIGFWYTKNEAIKANKKAFLVNRIGDAGLLTGVLVLLAAVGTLSFDQLTLFVTNVKISSNYDWSYLINDQQELSKAWLLVASIGICSGALAKSAQLPFSVWLPNAMEGPTPVSALIHAATMVAAGIYLLARFTFMFPSVLLDALSWIGALTALVAAITAVTQTDIKKVLAYSTISQLGYMVMAIGVRSYDSALFHLLTHAFFKAALFLCAGAIIHSLHKVDTAYGIKKLYPDFDEQNMKQMGGLRTKMPWVFWIYTIAFAGIIGVPFFTGFLSKDAILLATWNWASHDGSTIAYLIPVIGLFTVFLTAFYMSRQWYLVFFGNNRLSEELNNAPKGMTNFITKEKLNAPLLMKIPPVLLGVLTLAPVFSLNPFSGEYSWVFKKLPEINYLSFSGYEEEHGHLLIPVVSLLLALFGVGLAHFMFTKNKLVHIKDTLNQNRLLSGVSYNFMYLDAFYKRVLVNPTLMLSKRLSKVDSALVDGIVNFTATVNRISGNAFAALDFKIIDRIINIFGALNVIFAFIIALIDDYVVDGMVKLISFLGFQVGKLTKLVHKGTLQGYLLWSFVFVLLIALFINWIL